MIPGIFQSNYTGIRAELKVLEGVVTPILGAVAETRGGIVVARVKDTSSAFEKALLGKYVAPLTSLSDLLATTIVLKKAPTTPERIELESELKESFEILETVSARNSDPAAFVYDDLHYVLMLRDGATLLNKDLLKYRFELQVKSFLQYGWGICTHALNYKPTKESWRIHRLVSETRALVEIADTALQHGEEFLNPDDDRPNQQIDERVQIASAVEEWWPSKVPTNRRRLAEFVVTYLGLADISTGNFMELLNSDRAKELSAKLSVTVHQCLLILIVEANRVALINGLRSNGKFILITKEMEDLSDAVRQIPDDVRMRF